MGKYEKLNLFLRKIEKDRIKLNFDEIEEILGFKLPKSAVSYHAWWSNELNGTHSHARSWMEAGWKVNKINLDNQEVIFIKNDQPSRAINEIIKPKKTRNKISDQKISYQQFEIKSREFLSDYFKIKLVPGSFPGVPKEFDMISEDKKIVGDAKFYKMVRGTSIPPAKFSTIAEYVWFLEKCPAEKKFLVFGNDKRVPIEWLKRYGHLVNEIKFYFLDYNDNHLEKLN